MDSIVAVVDEDVILQSEMQERIDTLKAQITDASQLPPDDILREQIVERLIVESLQLQMAERAGVRINDEEINEALQGIAEQNRMSVAQFRAAIEKDGISYASIASPDRARDDDCPRSARHDAQSHRNLGTRDQKFSGL